MGEKDDYKKHRPNESQARPRKTQKEGAHSTKIKESKRSAKKWRGASSESGKKKGKESEKKKNKYKKRGRKDTRRTGRGICNLGLPR